MEHTGEIVERAISASGYGKHWRTSRRFDMQSNVSNGGLKLRCTETVKFMDWNNQLDSESVLVYSYLFNSGRMCFYVFYSFTVGLVNVSFGNIRL